MLPVALALLVALARAQSSLPPIVLYNCPFRWDFDLEGCCTISQSGATNASCSALKQGSYAVTIGNLISVDTKTFGEEAKVNVNGKVFNFGAGDVISLPGGATDFEFNNGDLEGEACTNCVHTYCKYCKQE